ncbi:sigma-54 interaction domain protein [Bordetella hinzii 1277]|nr:sigma-54 interaction domain protein [Bordetella hinzii 1277]
MRVKEDVMPHVLIVDDDAAVRSVMAEVAQDARCSVAQAATVRDARLEWDRKRPDLVLTDLRLRDEDGMRLFEGLDLSEVRVVVVTGHASTDSAVRALRLGASDYLEKPVDLARLTAVMQGAGPAADAPAGGMAGEAPAMQALREQIVRVARTDASVLLIGESGTGKELAAQAVHAASARCAKPFIAVNCGAVSPTLAESEMFGHERGSFTGAEQRRKGYFECADGGTLFLDEITEMPPALQVKLLRVLETGRFMRVGTQHETRCDVRIVAATNRDPDAAITEGRLREDLYYRLSVFPLCLPPLRERGEDKVMLAERFLQALNRKDGAQRRFGARALAFIRDYAWPGNVRELRNWVRRAYIMAEGEQIDAEAPPGAEMGAGQRLYVPIGSSLAEADEKLIRATLAHCRGVKKDAAAMLGISPKTLYNRLEGLEGPS